ncbi:lipopolysaccharide biosynthesis protein [uncultured Methylobacterium sp.]|uniref:lipopolysaccharide biosynthesis protein n=1 Tax=uncultured Methylobacterium sp. TaxID=157278 RepID=UPI0035CC7965
MLLRQTLNYLPAQLVGPLAQFIAVLAWTYWIAPSDYGFISLMLAVQELAFLIGMSWWTHYTVRYLPALADPSGYRRAESGVMLLCALTQVPVMLLALSLTGHIAEPGLVAVTLAFAVSRSLNNHLGERARALGDVTTYTIVQLAGPLAGFALGLAFLELLPDATAVIAGFAVVQIAILPVLTRRQNLQTRLDWPPDRDLLRGALAYGGPLLVAGGLGWLSVNGIRLVVEHGQGLVQLGLLSVGWNLGQRLIAVVATLVTAAAFPLAVRQAAQGGTQAGIDQIGRTAILLFGLLVPAAFGIAAVSDPLIRAVVGAEFQEATRIVLPLAAAAAAVRNLRMHLADQVFLIAERPRSLLALNAVEAVATMSLCAVGLAWAGLAGACLGVLAATCVCALVGFAIAMAGYGLKLPLRDIALLIAAALAMCAVVRLDVYPPTNLGLALRVAAGAAVYMALAGLVLKPMIGPMLAARRNA